jgi:hypothetical protein
VVLLTVTRGFPDQPGAYRERQPITAGTFPSFCALSWCWRHPDLYPTVKPSGLLAAYRGRPTIYATTRAVKSPQLRSDFPHLHPASRIPVSVRGSPLRLLSFVAPPPAPNLFSLANGLPPLGVAIWIRGTVRQPEALKTTQPATSLGERVEKYPDSDNPSWFNNALTRP